MKNRIPLAAATVLAALSLVACGGSPTDEASTTPTSTPEQPQATISSTPEGQPAPEQPSADPTCETIVSEGTVDALTSQGWTFEEEEFRIGETLIEDGLLCMWADFTTASDHGQMYAWGPTDTVTADAAKSNLVRDGWLRSAEDGNTIFTEDPAYAIATDEDGFGMTYEFGDGWVKFSDTKQGLLLIDWKS
ncbi:hypothetical protein FM104_08075 [Microbacterium esteraromaticum]|uniref:Nitrate ABC transporter substrate-binding protein n=1 Tax=Microbacterium esteraromaticum TaxID=57043 RepID=A0A1R4JLH4_9MICO|nr:hypothetical protein [Microbacterium esteraromaticum]SJN32859.1 hypothetical protein FM104_08075 [Microbacterium esteraromaticum]